jgi:DNA-binding HxlR family transcriptional regulator
MAFSKARSFNAPLYDQSFWSKALAHPARIIILTHLLEKGTTPFYILKKKIPLARTTVSQHIRNLRQAGLIKVDEKYPHTYYTLNQKACKALAKKIQSLQYSFNRQ